MPASNHAQRSEPRPKARGNERTASTVRGLYLPRHTSIGRDTTCNQTMRRRERVAAPCERIRGLGEPSVPVRLGVHLQCRGTARRCGRRFGCGRRPAALPPRWMHPARAGGRCRYNGAQEGAAGMAGEQTHLGLTRKPFSGSSSIAMCVCGFVVPDRPDRGFKTRRCCERGGCSHWWRPMD